MSSRISESQSKSKFTKNWKLSHFTFFCMWISAVPCGYLHLVLFYLMFISLFDASTCNSYEMILNFSFTFISWWQMMLSTFSFAYWSFLYLLLWNIWSNSLSFEKLNCLSFYYWFVGVNYIFWTEVLNQIYELQSIFPRMWLTWFSWCVFFKQKLLIFCKIQFIF